MWKPLNIPNAVAWNQMLNTLSVMFSMCRSDLLHIIYMTPSLLLMVMWLPTHPCAVTENISKYRKCTVTFFLGCFESLIINQEQDWLEAMREGKWGLPIQSGPVVMNFTPPHLKSPNRQTWRTYTTHCRMNYRTHTPYLLVLPNCMSSTGHFSLSCDMHLTWT